MTKTKNMYAIPDIVVYGMETSAVLCTSGNMEGTQSGNLSYKNWSDDLVIM